MMRNEVLQRPDRALRRALSWEKLLRNEWRVEVMAGKTVLVSGHGSLRAICKLLEARILDSEHSER